MYYIKIVSQPAFIHYIKGYTLSGKAAAQEATMKAGTRHFVVYLLLLLFLPTVSPTLCFGQSSRGGGFFDTEQAALHGEDLNTTGMTAQSAPEGILLAANTKAAAGRAGSAAGKTVRQRILSGSVLEWVGIVALVAGGILLTTASETTLATTTTSHH